MRKIFTSIVRVLLALALIAGLVAVTAVPASAQSVNSVTPAPATASATAGYTVNITTTVSIPAAGTITLTFPAGTAVPTVINKAYVTVAGVGLGVTDPHPAVIGQNVTIVIPAAAAPLAAGTFNVVIAQAAGITNPPIAKTAASGVYTMAVSTSAEGAIGTLAYEILPAYAINPTSGPRSTTVTVTGVGWTPGANVTIGGALSGVGATTGTGTFTLTAQPVGSGSVTILDGAGQTESIPWVGAVTVPTFTLLPTVTSNPGSGNPGISVTIRGYDFTSGGNIPVNGITLGGVAWGPASPITLTTLDAYGVNDDFQTTLQVPLVITPGVKTVQVTDSAAKQGSTTFTVLPPDNTPPAAVTNLAVIGGTGSSLTLRWTARGDDGNVGTASQYDIRYSTSAITAGNWNSATQCVGEPAPRTAGSTETFVVRGLSMATNYHFALKTADEVPNWSPLSNVPSATTPTPIQTPKGQDVRVRDRVTGVVIVFWGVKNAGWTTVFESQVNPCVQRVRVGKKARLLGKYYNISTTATYIGPLTVTIPYNDSDILKGEEEEELQMFACTGTYWDNVPKSSFDTVNNTVTGVSKRLSFFGLGVAPPMCFIATSAYGSYLDSHVETLRDFRDSYMVTNPVGSALVSTYYKLSPPVAEFIDDHPALKPIVRVALLPAVAMSTVAVNTTSAEKVAIVGSLALVSVALAVWLRRRRDKGVIY